MSGVRRPQLTLIACILALFLFLPLAHRLGRSPGFSRSVTLHRADPGTQVGWALSDGVPAPWEEVCAAPQKPSVWVIDAASRCFHLPGCSSVPAIRETDRQDFTGPREEMIRQGFTPCGSCHP